MRLPNAETFVLTLRAEAHEVPAIIRLRAALKRLLRDYGLRCVGIGRGRVEAPLDIGRIKMLP